MHTFELGLAVSRVTESIEDSLIDELDAVVSRTHDGQMIVRFSAPGNDLRDAAKRAVGVLAGMGLCPVGLMEDLVSRADIAEWLGVTRQAVGQWVRGERQRAFPLMANDVAGGVWLWGDVARWAATHQGYDTLGLEFPTLSEHDLVNAWLASGVTAA